MMSGVERFYDPNDVLLICADAADASRIRRTVRHEAAASALISEKEA